MSIEPIEEETQDNFDEDDNDWTTDEEEAPPAMMEAGLWDLMSNVTFGEVPPRRVDLRNMEPNPVIPEPMDLLRALFSPPSDVRNEDTLSSDDDEPPPPLIPAPSTSSNTRPQSSPSPSYVAIPTAWSVPVEDDDDDMPDLGPPISNTDERTPWENTVSESYEYDDSDDDLPPLASDDNSASRPPPNLRVFNTPTGEIMMGTDPMAALFEMFRAGTAARSRGGATGFAWGGVFAGPNDEDDLPPLD